MACSQKFLRDYEEKPDELLQSIVTEDETTVLYYDPLSKEESIEWRKLGEASPRKAKVNPVHQEGYTMFCDYEGVLLVDFKERDTTVNVA